MEIVELNMETSQGLLLAIGWFVLRFGLPVLVTGLLIRIFSSLDSRWKEEALSARKDLIREQVIPMMKCWVFNDCPPEKRRDCPAYHEKYVPCWQVFRDSFGNMQDGCLGCDVFRKAPLPIMDN